MKGAPNQVTEGGLFFDYSHPVRVFFKSHPHVSLGLVLESLQCRPAGGARRGAARGETRGCGRLTRRATPLPLRQGILTSP